MTEREIIITNLKQLFNGDPLEYLVTMWDITQTLDDVYDEKKVSKEAANKLVWNTLVRLPDNPFYQKNKTTLLPIVAASILKWQAANMAEESGKPTAMSYAWRAGYYELILMVHNLVYGYEASMQLSHAIMSMYGEKYEDYIKEIKLCQQQP